MNAFCSPLARGGEGKDRESVGAHFHLDLDVGFFFFALYMIGMSTFC